jgi:hypothetical protein
MALFRGSNEAGAAGRIAGGNVALRKDAGGWADDVKAGHEAAQLVSVAGLMNQEGERFKQFFVGHIGHRINPFRGQDSTE